MVKPRLAAGSADGRRNPPSYRASLNERATASARANPPAPHTITRHWVVTLSSMERRCCIAAPRRVLRPFGVLVLLCALNVPSAYASSPTMFNKNGVRATLPPGWWASDRRMSSGVEPVFRLTVSNRPLIRTSKDTGPCYAGIGQQIQPRAVVAILREAVGADLRSGRFDKRPARFVLPKRQLGQDNSCLGDHATQIVFKDAGRGFYLWIAVGRAAPPDRVERLLTLLNKLALS